jgi:hypothetical protein
MFDLGQDLVPAEYALRRHGRHQKWVRQKWRFPRPRLRTARAIVLRFGTNLLPVPERLTVLVGSAVLVEQCIHLLEEEVLGLVDLLRAGALPQTALNKE